MHVIDAPASLSFQAHAFYLYTTFTSISCLYPDKHWPLPKLLTSYHFLNTVFVSLLFNKKKRELVSFYLQLAIHHMKFVRKALSELKKKESPTGASLLHSSLNNTFKFVRKALSELKKISNRAFLLYSSSKNIFDNTYNVSPKTYYKTKHTFLYQYCLNYLLP